MNAVSLAWALRAGEASGPIQIVQSGMRMVCCPYQNLFRQVYDHHARLSPIRLRC